MSASYRRIKYCLSLFPLFVIRVCFAVSTPPDSSTLYCPIRSQFTYTLVAVDGKVSNITGSDESNDDCAMNPWLSTLHASAESDGTLSSAGSPTSTKLDRESGDLLPMINRGTVIYRPLDFRWLLQGAETPIIQGATYEYTDVGPSRLIDQRNAPGQAYAGMPFRAEYTSLVPKGISFSATEHSPELTKTIGFNYTSYYKNSGLHASIRGRLTVTYKRIDPAPYLVAREPIVECRGVLSCETKGTLEVQALRLYGGSTINARLSAAKDPDVEIYAESGAATRGGKVDDAGLEVTLTSQRTEIPIRYRVTGRSAGTLTKTVNYTLAID